jgi:hypothetical protein
MAIFCKSELTLPDLTATPPVPPEGNRDLYFKAGRLSPARACTPPALASVLCTRRRWGKRAQQARGGKAPNRPLRLGDNSFGNRAIRPPPSAR